MALTMRARLVGGLLLLMLAALAWTWVSQSTAIAVADETQTGAVVADLRQQLRSKLKCRRDLEFAFVDRVAQLVEQGILPRPIVNGAFTYALKHKPYPYPYFEAALRLLAERAGISLDNIPSANPMPGPTPGSESPPP